MPRSRVRAMTADAGGCAGSNVSEEGVSNNRVSGAVAFDPPSSVGTRSSGAPRAYTRPARDSPSRGSGLPGVRSGWRLLGTPGNSPLHENQPPCPSLSGGKSDAPDEGLFNNSDEGGLTRLIRERLTRARSERFKRPRRERLRLFSPGKENLEWFCPVAKNVGVKTSSSGPPLRADPRHARYPFTCQVSRTAQPLAL